MSVRVQLAPFDPGAETNAFLGVADGAGASVTFTGLVRSMPDDPVAALTLDCYPELALNQIGSIVEQAIERFHLVDATVIHRYGAMNAGEPIVQVMTLASHRQAAFDGAEFLMDF
ncbi:MAG: molybdenum cofactor biosynthesis protein MoaE, partial [Devosia sp.]